MSVPVVGVRAPVGGRPVLLLSTCMDAPGVPEDPAP
jgi:hypothetical protein